MDSRLTFTVKYYHVVQEIESYVLQLLEEHLKKRGMSNYSEMLSFFFRNRVFPSLLDLNRYAVDRRLSFKKWDTSWLEGQVLRTEDASVREDILKFTDDFYHVF